MTEDGNATELDTESSNCRRANNFVQDLIINVYNYRANKKFKMIQVLNRFIVYTELRS